jgi:hypothetical protein
VITSAAAYGYQSVLGYSANAGPGFNPENPFYTSTPSGQLPPNYYTANVIGENKLDAFIPQGGVVSKTLNHIPFVNAVAGAHDYFYNSGLLSEGNFTITNVPAMVPAALWAVPASLGNPNLNWIGTTNTNAINKK